MSLFITFILSYHPITLSSSTDPFFPFWLTGSQVPLYTSVSIIFSSPSQPMVQLQLQNTIRLRRGQTLTNLKLVCLSSLVSLSLLSLSHSLLLQSLSSLTSSKPLFPHFINLSTYITCHFNIAMCNMHKTCMVCPSYFIIHSLHTRNALAYTKLEWLVHCILAFTVCAHATLRWIQNLNSLSIVFYCSQSAQTQRSSVYKTWMACSLYFVVHSSPTCDALT